MVNKDIQYCALDLTSRAFDAFGHLYIKGGL